MWSRFFTLYHLVNILLASAYAFIREWYPTASVRAPSSFLGNMGITSVSWRCTQSQRQARTPALAPRPGR